MQAYTVSLFGHRQLSNAREVESALEQIIADLLRTHPFVEFIVGRHGEFDLLAASVIRRVRREMGESGSALVLVLPYMTKEYRDNEASFHDYYSEVEVCPCPPGMPARAAFANRYRQVIDRSDAVICCIQHEDGGAWQAVQYAEKGGKRIIGIQDTLPVSSIDH